jgi:hypothetical protein
MNESKINYLDYPFGELGKKVKHKIFIGVDGSSSKTKIFKPNEFKEELAPKNANIGPIELNGENLIMMSYKVRERETE